MVEMNTASERRTFAKKVNNTPVLGADGARIGHIEDIAIDGPSGEVAYAVLAFGGFMGLGSKFCPVRWDQLSYDVESDVYTTSLTRDQLRDVPAYSELQT